MDLTEKYFDAKFQNVNDNMINLSVNLKKVGESVDRVDGTVVEHGVRLSIVEKSQEDHIEDHKEHQGQSQFNIGIWIMVAIFAIDKISIFIERFLPPSP